MRFDPTKILLDPYGRGVAVPKNYSRDAARRQGNNAATAMKSIVVDPSTYDWEGDMPLKHPSSRTIVYETHVRGFTYHASSGVAEESRGTFAGLIEKIPYLQQLGITAVELLPVFQFDAQDCPPGLVNYWGYAPVSFFAPHRAYSSRRDALGPVDEFRDMVKALHRSGIEVILDVVFNHTAEGDHTGPTLSFRGLCNGTYYILEQDRSRYANYSGTGNTLNANNAVVRRMILDSLRYWVQEMHVDGFRFDLASILGRGESGQLLPNPPVLWDIESDPALAGIKLIAEAWDAAGLYQVGSFIGDSWQEWNGRFRDDVRSFFRGDEGSVTRYADRILGSPEIYAHKAREAEQSVNFVTCHDGFTLNDLVSYDTKHNEANGENNRDGANDNRSWNCGFDGPTDDPAIEKLRNRQVKNFLTTTLLSLGVPMIVMGDEARRTRARQQQCLLPGQRNELVRLDAGHETCGRAPVRDAARRGPAPAIRGARETARESQPASPRGKEGLARRQTQPARLEPVIAQPGAHLRGRERKAPLLLDPERLLGAAGLRSATAWPGVRTLLGRWIDTSLDSPNDIAQWQQAPAVPCSTYRAEAHSVVVLFADLGR